MDNFEKDGINSENLEDVADNTCENNINCDRVSQDSDTITDNFEDEDINIDVSAQRIGINDKYTPSTKIPNKGLRLFCILLAAVIVLSGFSLGGYYFGKYSSRQRADSSDAGNLDLEQKPENSNTMSASAVYSKVVSSVVGILIYNDDEKMGEASGVVYSENGYIITNDHIYSEIPAAKFKVFLNDGNEYSATYIAGDTRSDLAILKITENVKLTVPSFGDSSAVISGESVCAIGCPNGYSSKATITTGIVSVPKVRKSITTSYTSNFIQTDTAINPGNSGGALVNMYGQIIGITSSKIADTAYEGVGYAIPTKTVKKIVESLIENGNVKNRAKLGISYYFYNRAIAEIGDLQSCGLLVSEVSVDSDLHGKLEKGDIITRVNDILIYDDAIILDILEECNAGDSILLTVIKSTGETVNLNAVLLNDEGSSSYVNAGSVSNPDDNKGGSFNWPEGY